MNSDALRGRKLDTFLAYLSSQFPDREFEKRYDPHQGIFCFRVVDPSEWGHLLCISQEFLDDHQIQEIELLLHERQVGAMLRRAGQSPVLLTNRGLSIEG
jgi:hypothetical protein